MSSILEVKDLAKKYDDFVAVKGISFDIREGFIAIYLSKPIDYQLYTLSVALGSMLMNLSAITVPTVLMLVFVFRVPFEVGPGLFLFPVSLFLAFLISFNFDYFIGVIGFYSESIWGMSITKEIIEVVSGAAGVE